MVFFWDYKKHQKFATETYPELAGALSSWIPFPKVQAKIATRFLSAGQENRFAIFHARFYKPQIAPSARFFQLRPAVEIYY